MHTILESKILTLLENNGHYDYAKELCKYIELIESDDTSTVLNALERIQGLCRVRVLGDLYIKEMAGAEWLHLLSQFSIWSKKESKKIKKQLNQKIR